jgi:hypothetical protein
MEPKVFSRLPELCLKSGVTTMTLTYGRLHRSAWELGYKL